MRYIITLLILLSFGSAGMCQQAKVRDTAISQQFISGMMLTSKQVALYRQCRHDQRQALDSIAKAGITDRDARARAMKEAVARNRNLFYASLNEEQKRRFDLLEKAQQEKFLQEMQKQKEALQAGSTPQQ
jgi:hypothetical protein